MFLELIATFAAGLGAAGLVLALNMLTKGRLPKWAMPVAAGLAMIGITVSNEYTWGARTTAGLPVGIEIVDTITQTVWYRPWTYLAPQTVRLVALDTQTIQKHADFPNMRLTDLYLLARWRPVNQVPQMIDCANSARSDVTTEAMHDPKLGSWLPASESLIRSACRTEL